MNYATGRPVYTSISKGPSNRLDLDPSGPEQLMEPHISIDTELTGMEPHISIDTELAGMEPQISIDTELAGMLVQMDTVAMGITALELAVRESESAELVSDPDPSSEQPPSNADRQVDAASDPLASNDSNRVSFSEYQRMNTAAREISALARQDTAQSLDRFSIWEKSWVKGQLEALDEAKSAVPQPASSTSKPDSPEAVPPAKPAPSKKALSKVDEQSAKVQSKISRLQVDLEKVYGRESCDDPLNHPKVKELNVSLTKLRKRLGAINTKRYNMRR